MLCWLCGKMRPDRGGLCHACRRTFLPQSEAPGSSAKFKWAIAVAGLLSVAGGVFAPALISIAAERRPAMHFAPRPTAYSIPVAYQSAMVAEQGKRKVYPYSIVPGGARSVEEARRAMADPSLKAQYASFNLGQLKQVQLDHDIKGYVSYRWGDRIYWTSKKLTLHAGEMVFTDGTHIARGRCLNCYSALPMAPIRPHEPTEKTMDVAMELPTTIYSFPELPLYAPALPVPPAELTPVAPVLPGAGPIGGGGGGGGGIWFPLIPFIPPIHHHPGSPSSPVVTGTPPPGGGGSPPPGGGGSPPPGGGGSPPPGGGGSPPPGGGGSTPGGGGGYPPPGGGTPPPVSVVPEPGYDALIGAGLFAMILIYRRRTRK